MILSALVLSALMSPSPQAPAAPAAPAASSASVDSHIDAGLAAFKKKRFRQAEIDFRQAVDADPQSAAATWYLAYTYYKIAEPKRPFHPDKQKAADLFAKAYALDPEFKPVWAPGGGSRRSQKAKTPPAPESKPTNG
jgi:Tfp pilus assembly protein PilF